MDEDSPPSHPDAHSLPAPAALTRHAVWNQGAVFKMTPTFYILRRLHGYGLLFNRVPHNPHLLPQPHIAFQRTKSGTIYKTKNPKASSALGVSVSYFTASLPRTRTKRPRPQARARFNRPHGICGFLYNRMSLIVHFSERIHSALIYYNIFFHFSFEPDFLFHHHR